MRTTKVALFVAAAIALCPGAGQALEVPVFSRGGVLLGIEFGPGTWVMDSAYLTEQIRTNPQYAPAAAALATGWANSLKTSYCLTARLGYNIMGFASIEFSFTATGWDLGTVERGGGGFAAGVLRWHPLEILWRILKKDPRPFGLDASVYWGWGYGIAGYGDTAISQALGADGFAFQFGFDVEYYFNKSVGVSLGLRGAFPGWDHLYIDFDQRVGPLLPGTSRGAFWTPALGLLMRFGD